MSCLATTFLRRGFVTSVRVCAKPGYFLHKMIDREKMQAQKKTAWVDTTPKIANYISPDNTRRQSVLNALYLDAITDILSSEFLSELQQFCVQIHSVKILKNLEVIYVYWSCDESGLVNSEAANVLESLEPKIRKELINVRHMGTIPRVKFVFYTGACKSNAVHTLLHQLRQAGDLEDVEPAPIPVKAYPQVYGLDRDKILGILTTRSLPADFLSPEDAGKLNDESGKADQSARENFLRQFQKSKSTAHHVKMGHRMWRKDEESLIREFCGKSQEDAAEEQFANEYEEDSFEDDEPWEGSQPDEEYR